MSNTPVVREEDVRALEAAIEGYLADHAEAADTIEGIITWWLARQRYIETRTAVEQALQRLIARGIVSAYQTGADTVIYASASGFRPPSDRKL